MRKAFPCHDVMKCWYTGPADSRFAPSQWETSLLCNDVSHWPGASLESVLDIVYCYAAIQEQRRILYMYRIPWQKMPQCFVTVSYISFLSQFNREEMSCFTKATMTHQMNSALFWIDSKFNVTPDCSTCKHEDRQYDSLCWLRSSRHLIQDTMRAILQTKVETYFFDENDTISIMISLKFVP